MDYNAHFQIHLESLRPPHVSSSPLPKAFASEAGCCDRKLFFRLSAALGEVGDEMDNPSYTTSVTWHIGNNLHDEFQAMMAVLIPGFSGEVKWIYPSVDDPIVSGRCDGLYEYGGHRVALEIKTMTAYKYKKLVNADTPHATHALQAALSMLALDADYVQIVYICKDWLETLPPVTTWLYPVPKSVPIAELARMTNILRMAKAGGPAPHRMARGEHITNIAKDDECRFCPFVDECELLGP